MMKTIYISYPFSLQSQKSLNKASVELLKIFATGYKNGEAPLLGVNPLFDIYGKVPLSDRSYYGLASILMSAADMVMVVRAKGWEYCEIVQQEIAGAYGMGKAVIYADPLKSDAEQKL